MNTQVVEYLAGRGWNKQAVAAMLGVSTFRLGTEVKWGKQTPPKSWMKEWRTPIDKNLWKLADRFYDYLEMDPNMPIEGLWGAFGQLRHDTIYEWRELAFKRMKVRGVIMETCRKELEGFNLSAAGSRLNLSRANVKTELGAPRCVVGQSGGGRL